MTRTVISFSLSFLLILLFTPVSQATTSSSQPTIANQLGNHASPYLALHGNDPVHWQDWGGSVIARAKKENKLIFVSSGYFSCHWCHVMQRESFSDKGIARQLHQLAIPVKVDRELQPALDAWLIDFTEKTAGKAGWPLNVFLTPDGYPLVGLTYLPRKDFSVLLGKLQKLWDTDEASLRAKAKSAFDFMKPKKRTYSGKRVDNETSDRLTKYLITHALQLGDDIEGGFGDQNKFPMSPQLLALLDAYHRTKDGRLAGFLTLTLDQMANLGLNDHIGGGFYRYVVDPNWDIPHFEKMLYDNALLAQVYLRAAEVFDQPRYQDIALNTLDFILEMMQLKGGGYAASLSAVDDKDVEGGYYLWQEDELKKLLDEKEFAAAKITWGISGSPVLEDGHHLKIITSPARVAKKLKLPETALQKLLASATKKLKQAQKLRKLPVDNKMLAAWNGLLLSSLSEAARLTGKPAYKTAAHNLYQVLTNKLWDGGQLHRFIHKNKPGGKVSLEDYAYVTAGVLAWAKLSDDKDAWNTGKQIALAGFKRFHNNNGWQFSEQLLIPYDARELVLADNVLPASSAVLLNTLLTIAQHTNDEALKEKMLGFVEPGYDELASSPLFYATHIMLISRATRN